MENIENLNKWLAEADDKADRLQEELNLKNIQIEVLERKLAGILKREAWATEIEDVEGE